MYKNGKFNLETSPSGSVLIESAEVVEDMFLNVLFIENESDNDIYALGDTFLAKHFAEDESENNAYKVLGKMPKLDYNSDESDLDALEDMYLHALFIETERINNGHKVSNEMSERDMKPKSFDSGFNGRNIEFVEHVYPKVFSTYLLRTRSQMYVLMVGRDHCKVAYAFIRHKSKFSLVLVVNRMIVPVQDPGIGLKTVKLDGYTNIL